MLEKHIIKIFTFQTDQALSEVLKKYNLPISLQSKITAKFVNEEVTEANLADLIQKESSIKIQTAQQVTKDIMVSVIPTIKKMSEEEISMLSEEKKDELIFGKAEKKETKPISFRKLGQPIGVEKALQERQTQQKEAEDKTFIGSEQSLPKNETEDEPIKKIPKKRIKSNEKKTSEAPVSKKSEKPDSYREPIE